jgi:hypothetical protein
MLYQITLIALGWPQVLEDDMVVEAESRDEALAQRPRSWPLRRTRARKISE